jgi:hypothetical protein
METLAPVGLHRLHVPERGNDLRPNRVVEYSAGVVVHQRCVVGRDSERQPGSNGAVDRLLFVGGKPHHPVEGLGVANDVAQVPVVVEPVAASATQRLENTAAIGPAACGHIRVQPGRESPDMLVYELAESVQTPGPRSRCGAPG